MGGRGIVGCGEGGEGEKGSLLGVWSCRVVDVGYAIRAAGGRLADEVSGWAKPPRHNVRSASESSGRQGSKSVVSSDPSSSEGGGPGTVPGTHI